jgi:hypothetical protein
MLTTINLLGFSIVLLPIMFFHELAFGGSERTRRKLAVVKAIDLDLIGGWVFEDLVNLASEARSRMVAFGSIAFQLYRTTFL